ncbi:MAG: DNA ligase D [Deltaproteobacteria bacterium]|nr:DNA ligase D [Nannocystaceae bacterium]
MATATDSLQKYRDKRDFERTPEPSGGAAAERVDEGRSYCIQKHAASRLHYDFRLELDGVLKSWAVPKGPSLVPGDKRLAVAVEDHPVEYGSFEGVIAEGEYGGGTVLLWDRGSWEPLGDPHQGMANGKLEFLVHGEKLHGKFVLVKLARGEAEWLLLKSRDEHALEQGEIVATEPRSVASERTLDEIAEQEGATPKQLQRAQKLVAAEGASTTRSKPATKKTAKKTAEKAVKKAPARTKKAAARAPARRRKAAAQDAGTDDEAPPAFVDPQLATLVADAPEGAGWVHEIKLDGYRVQCRIADGEVTLSSRNQLDWTAKVPELVEAAGQLECRSAILDGELVWVDAQGRTDFSKLVGALGHTRRPNLVYFAFDLLHLDGRDLRSAPLLDRKAALQQLCKGAPKLVRYSDHVEGRGDEFFAAACELGVEGIISKRADAAHRGGRGRDWLKIKCLKRQELIIVGYTPPTHARDRFGSLVLAVQGDDGLVYAGRVGTGFARDDRQQLFARMEPLARKGCPLAAKPRAPGLTHVHWLEPQLVGEVAFSEWTPDGRLRHPSFKGLREDKPAKDVVRERPAAAKPATKPSRARGQPADDDEPAGVKITNPAKVLFADVGVTKLALAQYYAAVAPVMLPLMRGRPLMLLRCPDGTAKPCFYQKHAGTKLPAGVISFEVEEQDGELEDALVVESEEGLVGTVQMGALELHLWGSRRDAIENPDRMVLDLDPDPTVGFAKVALAAVELRERLRAVKLDSFVMSTGGKGLHVVVPLDPALPFAEVLDYSHALAQELVRSNPREFIAQATKVKRTGKIFIDYLRNGRGATAISPYSTRARPGAPVAVPLAWEELDGLTAPPEFTLATVRDRVAAGTDPWRGYDAVQQRLPSAASRKRSR